MPPKDVDGRWLAAVDADGSQPRPPADGRAEGDSHHVRPREGRPSTPTPRTASSRLQPIRRRAGERAAVALQDKDERESEELLERVDDLLRAKARDEAVPEDYQTPKRRRLAPLCAVTPVAPSGRRQKPKTRPERCVSVS